MCWKTVLNMAEKVPELLSKLTVSTREKDNKLVSNKLNKIISDSDS